MNREVHVLVLREAGGFRRPTHPGVSDVMRQTSRLDDISNVSRGDLFRKLATFNQFLPNTYSKTSAYAGNLHAMS